MRRKLPKRMVSILLVTMLIITLPITNLQETEAATKKVEVKFFVCSGAFKADINQGKKSITARVKKGKKMGMPPVVKRDNYVFTGWYTKKKGGKKYTANTKIKKKMKLYAHWVKKYKVNKKYEKILSTTSYLTFQDMEKNTGILKHNKKSEINYPDMKTYNAENGDIYIISPPNRIDGTNDYAILTVTVKAKRLINIKRPTKYEIFLKKLGVKEYNKNKKKKKLSLDFVTGTVNLVYDDPEENEWQYIKWEVKGIKGKKVTPDTKITLCLEEDWERV